MYAARPGGRALQGAETSTGGHMGPPLQSGWQPAPSSASHSLGTFPPRGKAFGRPQGSPLRRIRKQQHFSRRGRSQTGPPGFVPGALARQTQAQNLNRTECNFGEARPQWAGRKRRPPLKFCAPEIPCLPQGITPVMGAWGKAVIGERSSPLRCPPASFGSFSTGKRNSPRRAKPCKNIAV